MANKSPTVELSRDDRGILVSWMTMFVDEENYRLSGSDDLVDVAASERGLKALMRHLADAEDESLPMTAARLQSYIRLVEDAPWCVIRDGYSHRFRHPGEVNQDEYESILAERVGADVDQLKACIRRARMKAANPSP